MNVNELKSMSHEDLVRLVQEQSETIESLHKDIENKNKAVIYYSDQMVKVKERYNRLLATMEGIINLGKEVEWQ